jgi:hypothetical protein
LFSFFNFAIIKKDGRRPRERRGKAGTSLVVSLGRSGNLRDSVVGGSDNISNYLVFGIFLIFGIGNTMKNPKFQTLNPKQIPISKPQIQNYLGFGTLEFGYCLGFRY